MSSKPWAAPPRPTTYDRDPEVIYAAIGRSLSMWQYVEDALSLIFEWLVVGGQVPGTYVNSMSPAQAAYGTVVSFDARAGMIEAAASAFFHHHAHPSFHARLQKLLATCRGWAGRRNEIAHGRIGGSPVDLNLCALWPTESSSRKREITYRARFVYNSTQINEFDRQFAELHMTVLDFYSEFRSWRERQLGIPQEQDFWPDDAHNSEDQTPLQ
jgi:hypothetical protein